MKTIKILQTVLLAALLINVSCTTTEKLSPSQIKIMTTKQYDEPYDLVYKSAMSLLQSQQFVINETDYKTGLIIASKNIYDKKKATLTKGSIIIDEVNDRLTEVKISVYAGEEKNKRGYYGARYIKKTENMVEDPEYYKNFFNNLYAEIQRRKALR